MKSPYFYFACVLIFATLSCRKAIEKCEVCDGLLRNGTADSASFRKNGTDWEFKYFAYTPNGIDITYKDVPRIGVLRGTANDTMLFLCYNSGYSLPAFSAGSNKLKMVSGTNTMVYVLSEIPIEYALNNAICYSIRGDLLYIHYKESEGKNLFILQRK